MARRPTPADLHREAVRRSSGGKRAKAPCGHEGEHVFGDFVRCLYGCDGEAVVGTRPTRKTQCLHIGPRAEYVHKNRRWVSCLACGEEWEVKPSGGGPR